MMKRLYNLANGKCRIVHHTHTGTGKVDVVVPGVTGKRIVPVWMLVYISGATSQEAVRNYMAFMQGLEVKYILFEYNMIDASDLPIVFHNFGPMFIQKCPSHTR